MKSIDNLSEFITEFPKVWSFLGSPEEANAISAEHKDQIHFLNKEGTALINEFLDGSKMMYAKMGDVFNKEYFQNIETIAITEGCEPELKKWLFNRGIPFDSLVFVADDRSGQAVMLTWKMVIKYWEGLFFAHDLVIFDQTLTWGLFYFHHDYLYYGTGVIFDKEKEYQKRLELNELIENMKKMIPKK